MSPGIDWGYKARHMDINILPSDMPPDTLKPNSPCEYQVLKTKQKRYLLTSPRPSPSPSQIQKGRGEFGLWAVMNSIMNTVINTVMKPMMILWWPDQPTFDYRIYWSLLVQLSVWVVVTSPDGNLLVTLSHIQSYLVMCQWCCLNTVMNTVIA